MIDESVSSAETTEPVPARMLNELTYCPRLYYLEHVAGEWAESADTVDGRRAHRRVDRPGPPLAAPDADPGDRIHARSVSVEAPGLGVVAVIDLVEAEAGEVSPSTTNVAPPRIQSVPPVVFGLRTASRCLPRRSPFVRPATRAAALWSTTPDRAPALRSRSTRLASATCAQRSRRHGGSGPWPWRHHRSSTARSVPAARSWAFTSLMKPAR